MGQYRLTRRIAAPPEAVFRAFTEPALIADWMAGTGAIDVDGSLDVPGSTYTLVIGGPWRFRVTVIRSEPPVVHETRLIGRIGALAHLVAELTPSDGATRLDLLTEYTVPFGALGRWIDRRWIDREPRAQANLELDRLVELVSDAPPA
jgi:hypothetical protein